MIENPESLLAHADFVRALARQLVLDENRVDDVVQATWLTALQNPPRAAEAMRSWLAKVVRSIVYTMGREEERRNRREKKVAIGEAGKRAAGVLEGFGGAGQLLLRQRDGTLWEVWSGDLEV